MKHLIEVVRRSLRQPTALLAVSFVGLIVALKLMAYGWGVRFLSTALILYILWEISIEWRRFLPAFRRMLSRRAMRVMKSLRPMRQLPTEVPVLYGAVMMYMIARVALATQQWITPIPSTLETIVLGVAILIGALRHAQSMLARIAGWSWSKVLGKALSVVVTAICVALGAAESTRTTRLLTHADAKYFPSFVGLLSSWYVVLNFVRCAAIFLFACGLLLFLINLPSLFLRFLRGFIPSFLKPKADGLFVWWRRVRFGRSSERALIQGRYLRDVVELFTPFALLFISSVVISAPSLIMTAEPTKTILSQMLLALEYTSDGGCPNVAGNLPTVHLDGDFVSVATLVNHSLSTTRQTCHFVQQVKS